MKKYLLFLLLFMGLTATSFSQLCNGNLGENIFPDGDFGSGIVNILQTNPQIAPGYGYATTPPPIDGNYTITNNTSTWGSFARSWLNIGDNSNDPNGYMMVVNASHQPGLFYSKEIDGLCENTLYVFSADVHNLIAAGAIKPNVSFLLDGVIVFETGDVPTNQIWNTYGFTFTTTSNQTSITLSLQNNAPGGSGNDLALDNISFRACGPEAYIAPDDLTRTCEDDSPIILTANIIGEEFNNPTIQWQESRDEGQSWQDIIGETGMTYASPNSQGGYFSYRFVVSDGPTNLNNPFCRIVSLEKAVHVVPKSYSIIDTLCEGLSFSMGDKLYSTSGIFEDSLISFYGCDSIVSLDLTIVKDTELRAKITSSNPVCFEEENGSIVIDTIINGSPPYVLSINGELLQDKDLFALLAGPHNYHIEDKHGCSFDTLINLTNPPPFTLDIGEDISIELGDSINIEPYFSEPTFSTTWLSSNDILCETLCESLSLQPINSTEIIITAQTAEGACVNSDSLKIEVADVRKIFIPNAFSPNRDGINDNFIIFGASPNAKEIINFSVFDRWGGMVYNSKNFQANEILHSWDGIFKGKSAPEGVYIYSVDVLFIDDKILNFKGSVSLIR